MIWSIAERFRLTNRTGCAD